MDILMKHIESYLIKCFIPNLSHVLYSSYLSTSTTCRSNNRRAANNTGRKISKNVSTGFLLCNFQFFQSRSKKAPILDGIRCIIQAWHFPLWESCVIYLSSGGLFMLLTCQFPQWTDLQISANLNCVSCVTKNMHVNIAWKGSLLLW